MSTKGYSSSREGFADLDSVLSILENPVRRRIIQRLSEEPAYALQLSRELGLEQQLVTKHLRVLEGAKMIVSSSEPSPSGPPRRVYSVSQHISMSLAFGSNLFKAKIFSFGQSGKLRPGSRFAAGFLRRIETISGQSRGTEKLGPLAEIIADIDRKMEELDSEKAALLSLRNIAMHETSEAIGGMAISVEERKVLRYILNERDKTIERIAKMFEMNEDFVADVVRRLRGLIVLP